MGINHTVQLMSLQNHKEHHSSCQLCEIGKTTKRKVFFKGTLPCKYLFIGESPRQADVVIGQPFVSGSESGKVFKKLIKKACVENWAVANLILCFPPQKNTRAKYREPDQQEIDNCRPRLDEFIEIAEAEYYISLGGVAKKYPPSGISYVLDLEHPTKMAATMAVNPVRGDVLFKRNLHKLQRLIKETN
jgi:uracil-DNA glycosylase family 4